MDDDEHDANDHSPLTEALTPDQTNDAHLKTPKSKKRLILIVAVAIVLLGVGMAAYFVTKKSETSSDTATNSTTSDIKTTGSSATVEEVVAKANAFMATLSDGQKQTLLQDYSFSNAQKWSNFPQALVSSQYKRIGLTRGELNDTQLAALDTLIKLVTGSGSGEGYDEITQLLAADDYLAAQGGRMSVDYGRSNYYIAFLGTPSATDTWELQYGGHHFALANTYKNGTLAGATPSFRGVEPYNGSFTQDGVTIAPLDSERDAFKALLSGLSSEQLAAAKLSGSYTDLVAGPQKDWSFPSTSDGVKVSDLSDAQKQLVIAAIETYVNDLDSTDATAIMTKYKNELDNTYVAYSGTTTMTTRGDYIRIDGPSVWIEFSVQNGIVVQGVHPHSVWRDKTSDYGGTKS